MGTRRPYYGEVNAEEALQQKLEMSTAEIGLSVRTTNCLEERGIFTVQDLLKCTPDRLLGISNFGEKNARRGLQVAGDHRIFAGIATCGQGDAGRGRTGSLQSGGVKVVASFRRVAP